MSCVWIGSFLFFKGAGHARKRKNEGDDVVLPELRPHLFKLASPSVWPPRIVRTVRGVACFSRIELPEVPGSQMARTPRRASISIYSPRQMDTSN